MIQREMLPLNAKLRLIGARRDQLELVPRDLEALLPSDHEARALWLFVERMDLSGFYRGIEAVEGGTGRSATDPKVLVALVLYAATKGIWSAREVARLTESHDAYRWLRGGVPLNHHMVSDFRVEHRGALDKLLTQSIAVLLNVGAIGLERVAQDGTRVRASAGTSSFRRRGSLERCLVEAEEQLEWAKRNAEVADAHGARKQAADERAARQRAERVEEALKQLPEMQRRRDEQARRHGGKKGEVRASTTDPESRVMKMGDGGYRPAYNFQFGTDAKEGCVIGLTVTNSPADAGQLTPMLADILRRCGKLPDDYLVDGGYTSAANVDAAEAARIVLYGPVLTSKERSDADYIPQKEDSAAMAFFRLRMGSDEGKQTYRDRARVAEKTNAEVKERFGVRSLLVRGLEKATCIALWSALACNVMKMVSLGWL